MKIFPPPLAVTENEGFTPEKDLFKRAELGKGLTNLVRNVEQPMVLALDGQWGSGKTCFLQMWAGELRKQGFPVVYFDAFENDYSGDAFAALVSEVVALLSTQTITKKDAKFFLDRATAVGKVVGRSSLKLAVQLATMGAVSSAGLDETASSVSNEISELTDKHIGKLLTRQHDDKQAVTQFQQALSDLPRALAPSSAAETPLPLVFIIDELDRCRPSFALDLLERVKHFFNVSNVHFVLGVHLAQLENSVKVAYGSDIDANLYLQKFIHLSYQLVDESRHDHDRIESPRVF